MPPRTAADRQPLPQIALAPGGLTRSLELQSSPNLTGLRDIQAHDSIPQRRDLVYIDELP